MPESLGLIGKTEFFVEVTREPWTLPVDTLVVSASATGFGSLGEAVAREFPEARLHEVDLTSLRPDRVLTVKTGGPTLMLVNARHSVTAVPGRESAPTAASVAAAARSALSSMKPPQSRVALPLLGSGAAGLAVEACVAALVPAARSSDLAFLEAVYFVCADERAAAAVRTAWSNVQSPTLLESGYYLLEVFSQVPGRPAHSVLASAVMSGSPFGDALARRLGPFADELRQISDHSSGLPSSSSNVEVGELTAAAVAISGTRGGGEPEIQDLVAAVARTDPDLPGLEPGEFRILVRDSVLEALPDEDPEVWDELLGTVELLGGVSAEMLGPDEELSLDADRLAVGPYVSMLATVIARRNTPLPLSIGLFGEWGSGKSYFMRLLRGEVKRLADSGDPAYWRDIEPIMFNAWHYADTNLWASLGNTIFGALAGPGETDRSRSSRVRDELASTLKRRQELADVTTTAEAEAARLRREVDARRRESQRSLRDLAKAAPPELKKVWRRLGVADPAEQGALLADEIGGVRADLGVWRQLVAGKRGAALTALAVLALAFAVVAVVGGDRQWLAGVVGSVIALLGYAANGVRVVRTALRTLTTTATDIGDRAEASATAGPLAALRRAEADAQVAQAQLKEVVIRVGELGRELAELSPGQRLYSFVGERAASEDYRSRLGLVSTVRHDFEQLARLMDRWRTKGGTSPRPVDRIVLYIDDLDRCSPKQVMDVLQAVHLLLALDLFVVVLGVDPRVLLQSLRSEMSGAFGSGDRWSASPVDYLEKIFNIPFVLPGLTRVTFDQLIRGLSTVESPTPAPAVDPPADPSADAAPVGDVVAGAGSSSEPGGGVDSDFGPEPLEVEQGSETAAVQAGRRPAGRVLSPAELDMLASVGGLVRSPRGAKRLLNLYRMVRSTRDLGPAGRFLGTDEEPGHHQAVVVLLALLTAYPERLGELLWSEPGGLLRRSDDPSWPEVAAGLLPSEDGNGWINILGPLDDAGRREWEELVGRAGPATALVTLPGLEAFRYWAPHIVRFSFVLSPLARG